MGNEELQLLGNNQSYMTYLNERFTLFNVIHYFIYDVCIIVYMLSLIIYEEFECKNRYAPILIYLK